MSANTSSYRTTSRSLWSILFQFEGNIFCAVLPFCIINCLLLALVEYFEEKQDFGFSPTGHGLLTLLVSFLVISKVNLAYERFRAARHHTGNAFLHLRELNQLVITVSTSYMQDDLNYNDKNVHQNKGIHRWRAECVDQIVEILDATKRVLQEDKLASYLARNEGSTSLPHFTSPEHNNTVDPLVLVQSLRLHLYSSRNLQLLERVNLMAKLNDFVTDYRALLDLASTPMPFAFVQMGRAFLFLWTFSMPLVLRQGPFTDVWTAMIFLFFF
jgi:predicted membrane chloride channel (bestrophin family)